MNYSFLNKIIIRTPLKPFKSSFSLAELKELYSNQTVLEALFLSSQVLYYECVKWLNGEYTEGKEQDKLVFSLLKYAIRMHTRCTPFGMFAGCGITGTANQYLLLNSHAFRSTRLDMNYSYLLSLRTAEKSFLKPYLKYTINSSLYQIKDKIRYVEYIYIGSKRLHQIAEVELSDYLSEILSAAANGQYYEELIQILIAQDIAIDEATGFIDEIIGAQILTSNLDPSVTGLEPLDKILSVLTDISLRHPLQTEITTLLLFLKGIKDSLLVIDGNFENEIYKYEKLASDLKETEVPFQLSRLVQTDMFSAIVPLNNKQGTEDSWLLKDTLAKALRVLNKLTPKPSKIRLKEFKEKFYRRYENAEVPLMLALDNEAGIGYGANSNESGDISALLRNIPIIRNNREDSKTINIDKIHTFLYKKLMDARSNNAHVILIDEVELADFKEGWNDLSATMTIFCTSFGTLNGMPLVGVKHVGGTSAINLIGRFGAGNQDIKDFIDEISVIDEKNYPDTVLAEIAHLPENGMGNFLFRPAFRSYEIPYLSQSCRPAAQQIHVGDLYLSLKQNRLVLRSKRLGKEVGPRLGNAHNFNQSSLPVYHFLCDMQMQNFRNGLYFEWGGLADGIVFLPRVQTGQVILSYAIWKLKAEDYAFLFPASANHSDLVLAKAVEDWREKFRIPELFYLVNDDNELLIDTRSALSRQMFVQEIKKRSAIILKEYIAHQGDVLIQDQDGHLFNNELLVVIEKEQLKNVIVPKHAAVLEPETLQRDFSAGSEWLYYKIYCGNKTADDILSSVIDELVQKLLEQGVIDQWFFIRYQDPDFHLRVRFHLTDTVHCGAVITALSQCLKRFEEEGVVWKIQIDTYKREMERYGSSTMKAAEQLFFQDSRTIVKMIPQFVNDEDQRWRFALLSVNEFLENMNFTTDQKIELTGYLKLAFGKEFDLTKISKAQLDKAYRQKRADIEGLFAGENIMGPMENILKYRTASLTRTNEFILAHFAPLNRGLLNDFCCAIIHMMINRIFRSRQRAHELVLYDFLYRSYRTKKALGR
ncbi:lantibiotic dehydratase [Pedobacter sp. WC2423]|uniref:lantibiotic dehydratase n=1 Tax=Pedobacter sp. WC2423 TaxID=3234142 RepID=UPI0034673C7D